MRPGRLWYRLLNDNVAVDGGLLRVDDVASADVEIGEEVVLVLDGFGPDSWLGYDCRGGRIARRILRDKGGGKRRCRFPSVLLSWLGRDIWRTLLVFLELVVQASFEVEAVR
jgi:hypothetical protein